MPSNPYPWHSACFCVQSAEHRRSLWSWQQQQAEPRAAQPCQHQHRQTAEEKSSVLKFRKTSALYLFDLIVDLTSLCSPSTQWLSFVFHILREQMTYFSCIIIPGFSSLPPREQRRSAGGVFVEIYSWDLVGEWFGEKRGRAFSVVSWEVKMYSACITAPCNGEVCLQRVLIQKWARCKVSKLPGRDGVEENVWRVGGVEWGVASGEGGLTMGVQEEDAQVHPDPLPEPLVVYRQWGFWPQRTAETPQKSRERLFLEKGRKEGWWHMCWVKGGKDGIRKKGTICLKIKFLLVWEGE